MRYVHSINMRFCDVVERSAFTFIHLHDVCKNDDGEENDTTIIMKILLAVTGSVAAIKSPEIAVRLVRELNATVQVLLTVGGKNFWEKAIAYDGQYWESLIEEQERGTITILYAQDEWNDWNELGDDVLHINLRDWADCLLIAPLSAHTLAKIANGLCDDTLSCVARAWDFGHGIRQAKPMILAPAMNTAMWEHPLTQPQLQTIQGFSTTTRNNNNSVTIVEPQVKTLACGETGNGALASVDDILLAVSNIVI